MARIEDHSHRRERSMLDDLADAVAAADRLLPSLRHLLRQPQASSPDSGTTHRAPESSEPWNQSAAAVYWDIWYGARGLAQRMRRELRLTDDCQPGPEGLAQVLACGSSVSTRTLGQVTARLWSWVQQANALDDIGESEPWIRVPQVAGAEPPACPYCKTFGLRMQRTAGQVRCFFPDCRDLDGHPTRARMENTPHGARLVFADGTPLAFHAEHDHV